MSEHIELVESIENILDDEIPPHWAIDTAALARRIFEAISPEAKAELIEAPAPPAEPADDTPPGIVSARAQRELGINR